MRKFFRDVPFTLGLVFSLGSAIACFAACLAITFSLENPPSWTEVGIALLLYRAAFGWICDGGWWEVT